MAEMIKKVITSFVISVLLLSPACVISPSYNKMKILSSVEDLKNAGFDQKLITIIQNISKHDIGFNESLAVDTAIKISSHLKELDTIDPTELENYDNFQKHMDRFNRISDIIKENTGKDFGKIKVSPDKYNEIMASMVKYTPLIHSYNELIMSSRSLDSGNEESIKRFYIALFLVGTDIVLIESGAIYKGTYKSVGEINQALGLREVVPYMGYSGYGLFLSTIHWTLREYIQGLKDDLYQILLNSTGENSKKDLLQKGRDMGSLLESKFKELTNRIK